MPISKRDRVIHTSKVKKHDKSEKSEQIDSIRDAVTSSRFAYAVVILNERNNIIKAIRDEIKPGKLFYSKNKLIQVALGFSGESECAQGIHPLTGHMTGHCGLICTNLPQSDLASLLEKYEEVEYVRAGGVASETVCLESGFDALMNYPHSMEVQFRKLGMPTLLHDGKIKLLADYTVCKEGDILSASQARILKLLNIQMGKFQVIIKAVYDKDTESVSELL
jgi:mRNA turnover protein 4